MKSEAAHSAPAEALPAETKEKVLDAAERLFAEHGIQGASMREITRAAGVNLAAINYHFGTKHGLIAAVLIRRLAPLNQRRLALLNEVERSAGNKPPKLELILEAMIRPAVEEGFDAHHGKESFLRLTGRCLSEPTPEIEPLIRAHFEELIRRFDAAFLRAIPSLDAEELFWRITFLIGALHFSLLKCGQADSMPVKLRKHLDAEGLVQRLIAFTAAGLRATVPE